MMHRPRLRELKRRKHAAFTIHLMFFMAVALLAARGMDDVRPNTSPMSAFAQGR